MNKTEGNSEYPMVRVEFTLFTNRVGSACTTVIDFDAEEWADLDEAEREQYAKDVFWESAMDRLGGWDWRVLEA